MFHANMTLTGRIRDMVSIAFGDDSGNANLNQSYEFKDGTGDGEAQKSYTATRPLAGSANEDLDISGSGSLTTSVGAALALTSLKLLLVISDPANGDDLTLAPAASNGFVGPLGTGVTIKPGGCAMFITLNTGWTVDGTHKKINVANADSAAANYSIWAIGL